MRVPLRRLERARIQSSARLAARPPTADPRRGPRLKERGRLRGGGRRGVPVHQSRCERGRGHSSMRRPASRALCGQSQARKSASTSGGGVATYSRLPRKGVRSDDVNASSALGRPRAHSRVAPQSPRRARLRRGPPAISSNRGQNGTRGASVQSISDENGPSLLRGVGPCWSLCSRGRGRQRGGSFGLRRSRARTAAPREAP